MTLAIEEGGLSAWERAQWFIKIAAFLTVLLVAAMGAPPERISELRTPSSSEPAAPP